MKYVLLSFAVVLAACSEPTAPTVNSGLTAPTSLSLTKISESTPYEDFTTNPCNGEFVYLNGTTDTDIYTSGKLNGKTDVRTDIRIRGTGVSLLPDIDGNYVLPGNTYTFDSKTRDSFSSADPYPLHITTYTEIKLNGKGVDHSNDFTSVLKTVTHINQQGTITQDRSIESSRCGSTKTTP